MNESELVRTCPSRTDGAPALFTHRISGGTCAGRQSANYHKCFSCEHFQHGVIMPKAGLPPLPSVEVPRVKGKEPKPVPIPGQAVPAARLKVG